MVGACWLLAGTDRLDGSFFLYSLIYGIGRCGLDIDIVDGVDLLLDAGK